MSRYSGGGDITNPNQYHVFSVKNNGLERDNPFSFIPKINDYKILNNLKRNKIIPNKSLVNRKWPLINVEMTGKLLTCYLIELNCGSTVINNKLIGK